MRAINGAFRLLLIAFGVSGLLSGCAEQSEEVFQPLFDGQTFTGWEGPREFFRIEDGAIVAGALDREIPLNQFLCTEQTYGDFELRMQVKFTSRANNAGIQFRSARIPDHHEVIGYQADVGFAGDRSVWGSLYDESRRRKFLAEAPAEKISDMLRPEGWNDYRIRCEGVHIQFWLNGEEVLDYTEDDETIDRSGVICVQIHSGAPAEAWYRNIEIKEL